MKRFNNIASVYDAQIPEHIRAHLVRKKTGIMVRALRRSPDIGSRGLDIGCGTGWHVKRMNELGYDVIGADIAVNQLHEAKRNNGHARFAAANAFELPFRDGEFDFAYSINVLHHMPSPAAQVAAYREIARVVREGGLFFLHEINTNNPALQLYMDCIFPRLRRIDDGHEIWIRPQQLPPVPEFDVMEIDYFTFIPDFTPLAAFKPLKALERFLEETSLAPFGAHFTAVMRRRETRDMQ